MELFLVRHGETEGTEQGIRLGPSDPLSELGIKQSQILAQRLAKIHFDAIYSSPTLRAKNTAKEILSAKGGGKIIELPKIVERKEPSSFEGMLTSDVPWNYLKKHRLKRNWSHEDGESFDDIFSRSKRILENFRQHSLDSRILAVTHGSIIRAVSAVIIFGDKLTPRQYYRLTERVETFPASITVLKYSQKNFESNPTWKLDTWMDTAHLGE